MSLRSVRSLFRTISKRTDLVKADGSDSGANAFISRAQRYLDRRFLSDRGCARAIFTLPPLAARILLRDCISVKEVWCADGEGEWRLKFKGLLNFRLLYPGLYSALSTEVIPGVAVVDSSVTSGVPAYYTVDVSRPSPETDLTGATKTLEHKYGEASIV